MPRKSQSRKGVPGIARSPLPQACCLGTEAPLFGLAGPSSVFVSGVLHGGIGWARPCRLAGRHVLQSSPRSPLLPSLDAVCDGRQPAMHPPPCTPCHFITPRRRNDSACGATVHIPCPNPGVSSECLGSCHAPGIFLDQSFRAGAGGGPERELSGKMGLIPSVHITIQGVAMRGAIRNPAAAQYSVQ